MNTENTGSTGLCGRKTRICVTTHAKHNDARDANVRNDAPLALKRSHHVGNPHHRLQINEVSIRGRGARTATLAEQVGGGGAPDADGRSRNQLETYVLAQCAKTNSRGCAVTRRCLVRGVGESFPDRSQVGRQPAPASAEATAWQARPPCHGVARRAKTDTNATIVAAPEGAQTQSRLSNHKTYLTRSHEYTAQRCTE